MKARNIGGVREKRESQLIRRGALFTVALAIAAALYGFPGRWSRTRTLLLKSGPLKRVSRPTPRPEILRA